MPSLLVRVYLVVIVSVDCLSYSYFFRKLLLGGCPRVVMGKTAGKLPEIKN